MYMCVCVCAVKRMLVYMWRSEDDLQELDHSFYHPGPGDGTQVIRLGGKHLCLPGYPIVLH